MNSLILKPGSTSHSAYNLRDTHTDVAERHTLGVLVDNEPGVLARVIGLFSGRGYNIESLTVAETDQLGHLSRITIVTTGTPSVIEQIKAQLGRLVPVHDVHDLTVEGAHLERELALIKVVATGDHRVEAPGKLRLRAGPDHRRDRRFHQPDAPARPGRGHPHRRLRHHARRRHRQMTGAR
jgi:acetolactate synthase-1/3 small subunit